jgi:hypothetical protein
MKRAFSFGDKSIEAAVQRVNEVRCVAVIGAGTMGQGIAIDLLRKTDCEVILLDVAADALTRAREKLSGMWQQGCPDPQGRRSGVGGPHELHAGLR